VAEEPASPQSPRFDRPEAIDAFQKLSPPFSPVPPLLIESFFLFRVQDREGGVAEVKQFRDVLRIAGHRLIIFPPLARRRPKTGTVTLVCNLFW